MLSRVDAALVARDRALPGLATLLDPEAFAEALTPLTLLASAAVRPTYVRYKPGTRCLVAYDVAVAGDRLHVHANAYASSRWPTHLTATERRHGAGHTLVRHDRALTITLFPDDAILRLLKRLWNPETRTSLLRKLVPERHSLHSAGLETLAYNPERRYVGLLSGHGTQAVIKLYGAEVFRQARSATAVPRTTEWLRTPFCIGRSRRHRAVVLEWLPGVRLSDVLATSPLDVRHVHRAGTALAELHRQLLYAKRGERLAGHRDLPTAATSIGVLSPGLAPRALQLARAIDRARDAGARTQLVHGDFYASQVLVGAEEVGILDLDRIHDGDPLSDVGNFIAHLEYGVVAGSLAPGASDLAADGFLAGYEEGARTRVRERLRPHIAAGLLRLGTRPFRTRATDWADRIAAVLDRGDFHIRNHRRASADQRRGPERVRDPFDLMRDRELALAPDALECDLAARRFSCLPPWRSARRLSVSAIRVVHHKPGRRCLIEYDVEIQHEHRPVDLVTVIGKVKKKGADRDTFEVTHALHEHGFDAGGSSAFSVPEPIALLPEWKMWLQRKMAGTTADVLLGRSDWLRVSRRAAEVVHAIQRANVASSRTHGTTDELHILRERLSRVAAHRPLWTQRLERLGEVCQSLLDSLPTVPACSVHRDFHPGQLLMEGDRVHLLDLDLYAAGDPALDVGNFLAHIAERSLRSFGDVNALAAGEAAMVNRFLDLTPAVDRHRLNVFRLVSLARHVYISMMFPDRRAFSERILEYCEEQFAAQ
jgi:aminoglycoside phosphotransferase (APT) family kinase protein